MHDGLRFGPLPPDGRQPADNAAIGSVAALQSVRVPQGTAQSKRDPEHQRVRSHSRAPEPSPVASLDQGEPMPPALADALQAFVQCAETRGEFSQGPCSLCLCSRPIRDQSTLARPRLVRRSGQ